MRYLVLLLVHIFHMNNYIYIIGRRGGVSAHIPNVRMNTNNRAKQIDARFYLPLHLNSGHFCYYICDTAVVLAVTIRTPVGDVQLRDLVALT